MSDVAFDGSLPYAFDGAMIVDAGPWNRENGCSDSDGDHELQYIGDRLLESVSESPRTRKHAQSSN